MKATAFEFRFRFWIILAIYALGFTTPWDALWHIDPRGINSAVWGGLAAALGRTGAVSIGAAFNVVLVAAIGFAWAGAWLRIWGAASLGYSLVHDEQMRGDSMVAAGPYRYMRNPLYVGSWLTTLALAILMRPSGAIFTVVGIAVFLLRLMLAEEVHLRETVGEPYTAYCAQVPGIVPRFEILGSRFEGNGARAQWGRAIAAEVAMWGTALGFTVLGWRYDAELLLKCVLVSLGAALVVKGLGMGEKKAG